MKAFKKLIALLLLLGIVGIGAIAALLVIVDPNDYKDEIAAEVKAATGRDLVLEGPLELGLWPKIELKAGPLRLANAEGFSNEAFFAARQIRIAVATLPLLSRRLEMDTVVLHGIEVNLERHADGSSNWDDLAGGGETSEESSGGGLAAIILGGVDIQDTRLTFKDAAADQSITVSNVTISTGALTFGEPVAFDLALSVAASKPALDSDIKLNGTVSYDLDDEHYAIAPLTLNTVLRGKHLPGGSAAVDFSANLDMNRKAGTLKLEGLKLPELHTESAGQFAARDIEAEKPSANGRLNINGRDLSALFNAFQLPVGKQLRTLPDRSLTLKLAFDANMDSGEVTVSELDGRMLGATLVGRFDATRANTDKPAAKGELLAGGPDLPSLLAVVGQLQGADAATLKSLNEALGSARDKSFKVKLELDADLESGRAALPMLEAALLGSTVTGQLSATGADTDKPAVKGSLLAKGADFPTLAVIGAQFQGTDADSLQSLNRALRQAGDKSFEVKVDLTADLAAGTASLPTFSARLLGNSLSGELSASKIDQDQPAASGKLQASGADLPALLTLASQFQAEGESLRDMAKGLRAEKDRGFSVSIAFDSDLGDGRVDLPTLSAELMGLKLSGSLQGRKLDFEKNKGDLKGELGLTSQDLGTLLRSAGQADLAQSLKTLDLRLGLSGSPADLTMAPVSLTALVASPEVKKPVELKVGVGSARANMDKDTLDIQKLTVTGLGLNAEANLAVQQLSADPTFAGSLKVPDFDLRALLKSLNQPVPKTSDPKVLKRVGLVTQLAGTPASIKLNKLELVLDDTRLKGDIAVASFEGPDLEFGLGVDSINVDRYLEPTADGKKPAPVTPEAAAAGAASELPVDTLRALKIKGDLLIGSLVMSGAKLKDIKLSIRADGGDIVVKPIAAKLYEGGYDGSIALNAKGEQAVLELQTRLEKVNLEPLIMDTADNNMLAGIMGFNANLTGTGGDPDRLTKSLTGGGKFAIENGVLRGVDAVAILRAVEQILECKCVVPVPQGGETRFSKISGTLEAKNGVFRNNDLALLGDGFQITGKGMLANLHDSTLKYDLILGVDETRTSTATASYNLGGYTVPIACRGALEAPSCLPDFGDIVKNAVTKAATKAIGDKIKDAVGGDAGEALKKLFKF